MLEKTLILGFGTTGKSFVDYLLSQNQQIKIYDGKPQKIPDMILKNKNIEFFQDIVPDNILDNVFQVFISPGFNPRHQIMKMINDKKLDISTDIDLFKKQTSSKIISVTGTNGKTTVVSMIEHVLRKLKISCIACGNNGLPPLTITQSNYEYIILEISSYQLEYMNNFKSFISLLTNVTPDHLERHDTYKNYLMIKKKIFNDSDHCIANIKLKNQLDIKKMSYYGYEPKSKKYYINNKIQKNLLITDNSIKCNSTKLNYKGSHALENILSVISVIENLNINIDLENILDSIKSFKSLPHRIEKIASLDNVDWYNDSKSTNCESTIAALNTLEKDIILIIGGSHKIIDYKYLSEEINQRVKKIIFVGQNKEILKSELSLKIDSYDAYDYEDAVNLIMSLVSPGDKVLLSPASPSFDMFNNFEHRGDTFKKVVKKYVS